MTALNFERATELARRLHARELSAAECLEAHLEQISRVNPEVNAIVTLVEDSARARAKTLDAAAARGEALGPLHGLPIAIKDLELTKGIRSTFGSLIYKDHVPETSALFVERLEAAGAVVIGKTNTPELGAGSQTFNRSSGARKTPTT